jgi:hypothetical protein
LVALVAEDPDATLAELRYRAGVQVHRSTIHRVLADYGLTVKKKSCAPASRSARTSGGCARPGGPGRRGWTPAASCSSMRPARTRP